MINKLAINPNIFDLTQILNTDKEQYLKNLNIWFKFCLTEADIIILDKNGLIEKDIKTLIDKEPKLENRKKMLTIWNHINKRFINSKLSSNQFCGYKCQNILRLTDRTHPDTVFMQRQDCSDSGVDDCPSCFKRISSNIYIQYPNNIENWNKTPYHYSAIPEIYNFDSLIEYLKFDEFIKYCRYFTLYDKNIIPQNSNGITENYIYNLDRFFKYFKTLNISPQIITLVTENQNDIAIQNTKERLGDLANSLNIKIKFKILSTRDINQLRHFPIHNRYIFTDKVNYSLDKGLDIINKANQGNYSFEINMIPSEEINKFKTYLAQLVPLVDELL